ncbi:MAG: hypothetical protein RMJ14_03725 [Nitrososphaerota archaeon]|nr:hypothetical protein [Aigarchaeota archaeon]MDW8076729.1 hypothetical protein [Nitrososphaerota archaeon]
MFVMIAVVVAVIAAVGVAYYMTIPATTPTETTTPTPQPTPTITPSPTPTITLTNTITTPPTTTPTETTTTQTTQTQTETTTTVTTPVTTPSVSPVVNLKVGSYAKYFQKSYTEEKAFESYVTFRVDGEEKYNNVNCILLSTIIETQQNGARMKSVITWWLSKLDLKMVHGRMQVYYNDDLVFEREFSPLEATEEVGQPPGPIDVNYFVGYETVTVPAGNFINCIKVEFSEEEYLTKTWIHQNVPIFGLVKSETYYRGSLLSFMELVSYGS